MHATIDPTTWTSRYSTENVARIQRTRPTASAVATYHQWRGIGRQVRKGETGIRLTFGRRRSCVVFDISQTDPMRQCQCGTYAERDDAYCAECGQSLTTPKPEPYTFSPSAKMLRNQIKPICAAIRKETTAAQRRDNPIAGAIRIQSSGGRLETLAYLFDEQYKDRGPFPSPAMPVDILIHMEDAYALGTLIDPKKPVTLSVEDRHLVVSQPSSCPGRTDVMRFKLLEV